MASKNNLTAKLQHCVISVRRKYMLTSVHSVERMELVSILHFWHIYKCIVAFFSTNSAGSVLTKPLICFEDAHSPLYLSFHRGLVTPARVNCAAYLK